MSRWRLVLVTCPGVGIRSVLVWLKRRWKCDNPGCGRATFTEVVPQVPAGVRLTERLREQAAALVGEVGASVSVAAGVCGLSWPRTHQGLHRAR